MKVLVVGGAGYLGGAVTDALLQTAHECRIYDALLYEEAYRKPGDFVYGDVRDHAGLFPHLLWADAVIWLAGLVGDGACELNPDITVSINEEPIRWLAANYSARIIFISSCSVYGARKGAVLTEASPTGPLSTYAATKIAAEKYLAEKDAIIFRLGTLFGVGDQFSRIRLDLVVNTLTAVAYRFGKINVSGGDQFRPLLHVRDAAQAVVDNIASPHSGVYNLHRQNVRIMDLAYQVRNHFPDVVIERTDMRFEDPRDYRVSSEKAQRILGFKAVHSIDDGIEEIKSLLDSNRLKQLDNPRYANHVFLSTYNTHKIIAAAESQYAAVGAGAHAGGNGETRKPPAAVGRPAAAERATLASARTAA